MARNHACQLCGRNGFSSNDSVIKHIKNEHVGKLSDGSIEHLLLNGVKPDKIIKFCRENRIEVDERKVWRIATKLAGEGKI